MGATNSGWDILFKIGGLAGLASFIWLVIKDVAKFCRKPELHISYRSERDLRIFTYEKEGFKRKFVTLHVHNTGKDTARRCVAIMNTIKKPTEAMIIDEQYHLHWANVPISNLTTGAEPIDIGQEVVRLDVLFTQENQDVPGCWAAVPFALSGNLGSNQMYFSPGEYEFEVIVSCENGKESRMRFKLTPPTRWDELHIHRL